MRNEEAEIFSLVAPVAELDHRLGPVGAPVTLVEYGDYECPHSYQAFFIVKDIQKWLGNGLCFVFRHFPLIKIHPHAARAASAAEAADAQGFFWEMHDQLFVHQQQIDDEHLTRYAEAIGLDSQRFIRDLEASTYRDRVQQDITSGRKSGVRQTPTFFINGKVHQGGWELDDLVVAIEQAAFS